MRLTFTVGHSGLLIGARRVAALAFACLLAGLALLAARAPTPAEGTPRPNIVVIQTDDQTLRELYATWLTPLS